MRKRVAVAALALTSIFSSMSAKAQEVIPSHQLPSLLNGADLNQNGVPDIAEVTGYISQGCAITKDDVCKTFSADKYALGIRRGLNDFSAITIDPTNQEVRYEFTNRATQHIVNIPSESLKQLAIIAELYSH